MHHSCRLFGLQIDSEIPLPELDAATDGGYRPVDVEIRLGPVDPPERSVRFLEMLVSVQPELTVLDIPRVGRFQVMAGRQIIADPLPECSADLLRVFLLGSTCGALLYQRGMLPLHANAIEVDGRVFAFAGRSGTGKSTLAAYFNDRGYRVLCDDVCALSFTSEGVPQAWAGLPRLKLWADALQARGQSLGVFRRISEKHDKYHFPVRTIAEEGPFPLARLYTLEEAGPVTESGIAPLDGTIALNAVLSNIYRRRLAELSVDPRRHLQQVGCLIKHTGIYAIKRRWGYEEFSVEAEKLETHLRS